MKRFLVLLPLLFMGEAAHADVPAVAPQDCGTVVIPTGLGVSTGADITSFNPLLVTSLYNEQAASMMYLKLFWIDGNTSQIDWSRSLAQSVTSPDNGTTYDVTLKNWHWSDGVPITSADVAYTFSLIKGARHELCRLWRGRHAGYHQVAEHYQSDAVPGRADASDEHDLVHL